MSATGILGGTFNPPHLGHLALARRALVAFSLDRLLVRVVDDPGHKRVDTPGGVRLELARIAFAEIPEAEVTLDTHPRTIDSLLELAIDDPVFLIGADEFADLLTWKQPARVLELTRLGVATRPGVGRAPLERVLRALPKPERVMFFEIEPHPISSSEIRRRVAAGESIDDLVPAGVVRAIEAAGLYGCS